MAAVGFQASKEPSRLKTYDQSSGAGVWRRLGNLWQEKHHEEQGSAGPGPMTRQRHDKTRQASEPPGFGRVWVVTGRNLKIVTGTGPASARCQAACFGGGQTISAQQISLSKHIVELRAQHSAADWCSRTYSGGGLSGFCSQQCTDPSQQGNPNWMSSLLGQHKLMRPIWTWFGTNTRWFNLNSLLFAVALFLGGLTCRFPP